MANLLEQYEARIKKREAWLNAATNFQWQTEIGHLKFTPDGEIKPFYGLTCITWVTEGTELYTKLAATQRSIQAELSNVGVDHVFYFLDPLCQGIEFFIV